MTTAERNARIVRTGMIGGHLACFGAFFTGVSSSALWVALCMYVVRAFGITAGFHRLLAHGAFKASRGMRFFLTLLGSLAVQGGPLWWVSHHRRHHQYTETERDIHSPQLTGFWYSHMGWMWDKACFEGNASNVKDLHRYPEIKFLQKTYPLLILGEAVALYLFGAWLAWAYPSTGTSGAQMLVWGFFISTVALWHATFMVNSVCHIWGRRPHDAGDSSANNWLVAALTLGEGWHNNHHKYAYSARHGLRWWQLDVTWLVLRGLSWVGLVSELRLPRRRVATPAA